MKNLIVTNNGKLRFLKSAMEKYFEIIQIDGTSKDVAEISREYLMTDYQLAADPMAGRRERPTPYLTIVLEPKNIRKDHTAGDILRVEGFCAMFDANKKILEQIPESHKKDFSLIDYTLTMSVCDKMLDC